MTPPQLQQVLDKTEAFMAEYPTLSQYDLLAKVEKKLGYPKQYFFLAGVLLVAAVLFMIGGTKLVTDLLAFVYPAYMSFKAIDNKAAVSGKDDLQWLTYWVVYAAFALVDRGGEMVLNWIPFYFYFKCAFLVWLYHPKTQGATLVYQQGIRPFVLPYLPKEATTKKAE